MNKNTLRNKLNDLDELKKFYNYTQHAAKHDYDISIKVNTKYYSFCLEELVHRFRKIEVSSEVLLTVLESLIDELEEEIDKVMSNG